MSQRHINWYIHSLSVIEKTLNLHIHAIIISGNHVVTAQCIQLWQYNTRVSVNIQIFKWYLNNMLCVNSRVSRVFKSQELLKYKNKAVRDQQPRHDLNHWDLFSPRHCMTLMSCVVSAWFYTLCCHHMIGWLDTVCLIKWLVCAILFFYNKCFVIPIDPLLSF